MGTMADLAPRDIQDLVDSTRDAVKVVSEAKDAAHEEYWFDIAVQGNITNWASYTKALSSTFRLVKDETMATRSGSVILGLGDYERFFEQVDAALPKTWRNLHVYWWPCKELQQCAHVYLVANSVSERRK